MKKLDYLSETIGSTYNYGKIIAQNFGNDLVPILSINLSKEELYPNKFVQTGIFNLTDLPLKVELFSNLDDNYLFINNKDYWYVREENTLQAQLCVYNTPDNTLRTVVNNDSLYWILYDSKLMLVAKVVNPFSPILFRVSFTVSSDISGKVTLYDSNTIFKLDKSKIEEIDSLVTPNILGYNSNLEEKAADTFFDINLVGNNKIPYIIDNNFIYLRKQNYTLAVPICKLNNAKGKILSYGTSTDRPTVVNGGFQYFDTTLNQPIYWTGTKWITADGTVAYNAIGTTAQRPTLTTTDKNFNYYDTDLGCTIIWDGSQWVNRDNTLVSKVRII